MDIGYRKEYIVSRDDAVAVVRDLTLQGWSVYLEPHSFEEWAVYVRAEASPMRVVESALEKRKFVG